MLGRESLYRMKKKCIGGCALQKRYNENVMVNSITMLINTFKHIEIH
jgi:hypothetical protein